MDILAKFTANLSLDGEEDVLSRPLEGRFRIEPHDGPGYTHRTAGLCQILPSILDAGIMGYDERNILKVPTGIELYPFLEVKKVEEPPNKISMIVEEIGKVVIELGTGKDGMEFSKVNQCNLCGKTGKGFTCSKCKYARYCGVECQRENWKHHKPSCRTISAFKEIYKSVVI